MNPLARRLTGCFLLLLLSGCEQPTAETKPPVAAEQEQSASAPAPSREPDQTVALTVATETDLQKLLEEHRGKVILIDFWATWCEPCMENFPHIVELSRKHAADGLQVISISTDDPDSAKESALEFLQEQHARFPNLISQYGAGQKTPDKFGYPGSVPWYKLYDRAGKLRYQFSDQVETLDAADWPGLEPIESGSGATKVNHIDQRLAELLAETPPG